MAFDSKEACFVVIDGMGVIGPLDFRLALLTMFASYYVFNISYPPESAATLEFLQRYVCLIM
jgi:hypothetical protein